MSIFFYQANHKKWDRVSPNNPNVEVSESIRPAEEFKPADYLAVVRYDKHYEDWFVAAKGKLVSLDVQGRVVPSGLALQAAAYKTAFEDNANADTVTACKAAARAATGLTLYTVNDVALGIENFAGVAAMAGEPVVESFFTMGSPAVNLAAATGATAFLDADELTQVNPISKPIGVSAFPVWRWCGGDGSNPTQYNQHNYNLQHQIAVLCDYYIELPVCLDTNYAAAAFTGIAAAIYTTGVPFYPGDFLKADMNSNFAKADPTSDSFFDIVGQILAVDTDWPKDHLDRVRTAYPQLDVLNRAPGSATGGLPDAIYFANGSAAEGMVRVNLINR
jgi:hypothetical protein